MLDGDYDLQKLGFLKVAEDGAGETAELGRSLPHMEPTSVPSPAPQRVPEPLQV